VVLEVESMEVGLLAPAALSLWLVPKCAVLAARSPSVVAEDLVAEMRE
jgi:hypothetical protein